MEQTKQNKLLFINGCMRDKGVSRTYELADAFLKMYREYHPYDLMHETPLRKCDLLPVTAELAEQRMKWMEEGDLDQPVFDFARDFAAADCIVIAAPYWDLSFPALLKVYLETICVSGITFRYENDGAVGLCNAKNLIYLTTCGGYLGTGNFGYDYIEGLCHDLLGIPNAYQVAAEGLDIIGVNAYEQLQKALIAARRLAVML